MEKNNLDIEVNVFGKIQVIRHKELEDVFLKKNYSNEFELCNLLEAVTISENDIVMFKDKDIICKLSSSCINRYIVINGKKWTRRVDTNKLKIEDFGVVQAEFIISKELNELKRKSKENTENILKLGQAQEVINILRNGKIVPAIVTEEESKDE